MHGGQILITMGALVLLTLVVLNVNKSLNANDEYLNQTRFGLEAVSLGTSIIEQASQLPFDEVSWDSTKIEKKVSDFTNPNSLGKDFGETTMASFDDFDDFNAFTRAETTAQNIYNLKCLVEYVNAGTPNVKSVNRTYCKKLTIAISTPYSPDTLKMGYVHGYWYFN
ncbi:MAG: hypothetical protein WAN36_04930 [Calditrichia bacterium]